jgi:hypothetical protein
MSSLEISAIVLACVFGGAFLAMLVGRLLPEHHLQPDSKDTLKQGLALIATLSALVLGLLIAAAKGTYDTQSSAIKEMAADVLLLDRVLTRYGPEAQEERDLLRRSVTLILDRLWPETNGSSANLTPGEARTQAEMFYEKLLGLSPKNDTQRALKARALDISNDLEKTRLRLFAQKESSIPLPFLVVLVFWLTIIFVSFGLFAPANATVVFTLFVCALSVSGAIFLILELDRPFGGLIQVSSAPLRDALVQLGR